MVVHVDRQIDTVRRQVRRRGSRTLLVSIRAHDCVSPITSAWAVESWEEIEIKSGAFTTSIVSGSSFMCEILMFFSTSSMLSFTFRNGSRTVQTLLCPHSPRTVTQEVMNNGPSIAWMTSKAEIVRASRASVYPPLMPC